MGSDIKHEGWGGTRKPCAIIKPQGIWPMETDPYNI
jgi:hypothetical protein